MAYQSHSTFTWHLQLSPPPPPTHKPAPARRAYKNSHDLFYSSGPNTDGNGIQLSDVQPLDGVPAHVKNTVLPLLWAREKHRKYRIIGTRSFAPGQRCWDRTRQTKQITAEQHNKADRTVGRYVELCGQLFVFGENHNLH